MKTKNIRQPVTFKASPHDVYESLMDSRRHTKFTGEKANISRTVGGKFTAYEGYIHGINLELLPDKKIVQSWRGSDWPEGHYSWATLTLKAVKGGTRLIFTQSGVAARFFSINQGWRDYYWALMKQALEADSTVRNVMVRYSIRKDTLVEVKKAVYCERKATEAEIKEEEEGYGEIRKEEDP